MFFFFFQAEDGIRDLTVTGVQTCALPISGTSSRGSPPSATPGRTRAATSRSRTRAGTGTAPRFCRTRRSEERRVGKGVDLGGRRIIKKKKKNKRRGVRM